MLQHYFVLEIRILFQPCLNVRPPCTQMLLCCLGLSLRPGILFQPIFGRLLVFPLVFRIPIGHCLPCFTPDCFVLETQTQRFFLFRPCLKFRRCCTCTAERPCSVLLSSSSLWLWLWLSSFWLFQPLNKTPAIYVS